MEKSHLQELIDLEDNYWWHIAKRKLATSLLKEHFPPPGRVVEGGVGSARNLVEFQRLGYQVSGYDLMEESVEHARSRGLDDVRVHDLADPWPVEGDSIDAVVLLDVIEHLEDPVRVLSHARQALRVGGGVIVTVPAYPWLFSEWDQRLGHFRRYTGKMLRKHAEQSGLQVAWLQHWNAFSLAPAIVVRGFQRLFPRDRPSAFPRVSPLVNNALLQLAGMERWCLRSKLPVPFGLSLVGVLKR